MSHDPPSVQQIMHRGSLYEIHPTVILVYYDTDTRLPVEVKPDAVPLEVRLQYQKLWEISQQLLAPTPRKS